MSKGAAIKDLRKGDVVKVSQVLEVEHVSRGGSAYVEARDVRSGYYAGFTQSQLDSATYKIEVLKKARPSVGDVITARELRDTPWRRGTIVKTDNRIYMLTAEGDWFSPVLPDDADGYFGLGETFGGWLFTFDYLTLSDDGFSDVVVDGNPVEDHHVDHEMRFTVVSLP